MDRQAGVLALLTALVLALAGHLAAAARPRSGNGSGPATTASGQVADQASPSEASPAAADHDHLIGPGSSSSSAAQTWSGEASGAAAQAASATEVRDTLAKLADAVARWGEFLKKQKQPGTAKAQRKKPTSSSSLVALGGQQRQRRQRQRRRGGARANRTAAPGPEEDEGAKKNQELKNQTAKDYTDKHTAVEAANEDIKKIADTLSQENDEMGEKVKDLDEKGHDCGTEDKDCQDEQAYKVIKDGEYSTGYNTMADACGNVNPPENNPEESSGEAWQPDAVKKKYEDCLTQVHEFAEKVVMGEVRGASLKANELYGKAATNVATRLELLAAYKPSFLAINADHTANVVKLLEDAKDVTSAIDQLINRNPPEVKEFEEPSEDGAANPDCDDENNKKGENQEGTGTQKE